MQTSPKPASKYKSQIVYNFCLNCNCLFTWITVAEDQCSLYLWHRFAHFLKKNIYKTPKTHATWDKILNVTFNLHMCILFPLPKHIWSTNTKQKSQQQFGKNVLFLSMSIFFYTLSETTSLHFFFLTMISVFGLQHFLLFKEIPVSNDLLTHFRFSYINHPSL